MTAANVNLNDGPGPVGPREELGRSVFSGSHSRRAARGKIPFQVFFEEGNREISVVRLSLETDAEAAQNARMIAAQRDPPRNFYGWAVVIAESVSAAGYAVKDSPLPDNQYHADIILPDDAMENVEAQREYAIELAGMSQWRPRPLEPDAGATPSE